MMKIIKVLKHIFIGIYGLLRNRKLKTYVKLLLIIDLVRLVFNRRSPFTIRALGLQIYYPKYEAFVYLFNEIFLSEVYPTPSNLKTLVDCGANIGLSIIWYKILNPKLKVIAFEPDPEAIKFLRKNLRINKIKGVRIVEVAVGGRLGRANFYKIQDDLQNLDSGLRLNQNYPYKTYVVKTVKLSGFLKRSVSLVKMDIEGGEYEVIANLIQSGKIKNIEKMALEAHYFNREDKKKLKGLVNELKRRGKLRLGQKNENSRMIYFNL